MIALAPMAGVTDWPFRSLCARMGADLTFTEMVSAMGYVTAPASIRAYSDLLETHPDERDVAVQIFGHDPWYMQEAAKRLEGLGRFTGIDINMGCPAHKVTGSGSGCALMKEPALAACLMRAVRKAVSLPVSVKLRLGWDEGKQNAGEIVRIAGEEGLCRAAVHGRTRAQGFSGEADRGAIARVKQDSSIPVIANGDVFAARDALDVLADTGADGVMIGRGALGNPWIFREILLLWQGSRPEAPGPREILDAALEQAERMAVWKGERNAVIEMRKHFSWYLKGKRGAAEARRLINQADKLDEVRGILETLLIGPGSAKD